MNADMLIFPLNLAIWAYASIAIMLFARRNFRMYHSSRNPLHKAFARFMLTVGIGIGLYSIPALFLYSHPDIVRYIMPIAIAVIAGSMATNTYVLYHINLLSKSSLRIVVTIQGLLALIVLFEGFRELSMVVPNPYNLSPSYSVWLGSASALAYASTLLPTGLFFLVNGVKKKDTLQRLKSITFSAVYLGGCTVSVYLVFISRGVDTLFSSTLTLLTFSALLWLALSPVTKDTLATSPLQTVNKPATY